MSEEREGVVVAVCVGPGGIPKHPVESVLLSELGLAGDAHRRSFHGGPRQALCLFALEDYRALERDGVRTHGPGTFGENVVTEGLDYGALRPGDRLAIGDEALVEIDDVRAPCNTLRPVDRRFPDLMVGRSGWKCRVLRGGDLRAGQRIRLANDRDP